MPPFPLAVAAMLAAAWLPGASARAQTVQGRPSGPAAPALTSVSCDHLPPEAAASVPAPFDRYMRLTCRDPVGQGLQAVEGFRWTTSEGMPIGLTAMSAVGAADAHGGRRFATSWYVSLTPVDLPLSEQRRLKLAIGRVVRPHLLDGATLLELRARTSNEEEKLILIVVPGVNPGKPAWLIGLECNGSCFRKDGAPLIFTGSAG